jgi:membrane protein DedA with SNARE-associated domain
MDPMLSLLTPHVYLKLAGVLLLCGLGLPIPEDVSLVSAGYLAYLGAANVHTAFLVCLGAVMAGDLVAFAVGRWFGKYLLGSRIGRRLISPQRQLRLRAYFRKYGSKVVFVARFLPGLRFSSYLSAGMLRVRPQVFVLYDLLAALVSVPLLVYLAWYFGGNIEQLMRWVRCSEYGMLALAAVGIAYLVVRLRRRRSARALSTAA